MSILSLFLKQEISGASSRAKGDGVSKGELCDAPLWSPLARAFPRRRNIIRKQSHSLAPELLNTVNPAKIWLANRPNLALWHIDG